MVCYLSRSPSRFRIVSNSVTHLLTIGVFLTLCVSHTLITIYLSDSLFLWISNSPNLLLTLYIFGTLTLWLSLTYSLNSNSLSDSLTHRPPPLVGFSPSVWKAGRHRSWSNNFIISFLFYRHVETKHKYIWRAHETVSLELKLAEVGGPLICSANR